MKHIRLFAAILLAVSCNVKETPEAVVPQGSTDQLFAEIEGVQPSESKAYVDDQLRVLWHADDRISVFNKYTYNQEYQFTGQTGDNAGAFNKVEDNSLVTGNALPSLWAVYPYQASNKISNDGVLSVEFPGAQNYVPNSFGRGAGTMVSATDDNRLLFKNACGVLVFRFYGSGVTVNSITLRGNGGEKIAGAATITMAVGSTPSVTMASNATEEITLNCATPVTLGASESECTAFWITLPPTEFPGGFTVTVAGPGGVFEKSTVKNASIVRNHLTRMAPVAVTLAPPGPATPEYVDLGLSVKWATFNVGANKPEEGGEYFAWGETAPKTQYDWTTYLWCNGDYNNLTKYCSQYSYGQVDSKKTLEPGDDAAAELWGGTWRMPTNEDWGDLIDNCKWQWTTENGVNGYRVTSKVSGHTDKSIFLPAAGEKAETSLSAVGSEGVYWSSNTVSGMSFYAYYLSFTSGGVETNGTARYFGFPVRPVCP